MSGRSIKDKWRPHLALVLAGTLLIVLSLPILGFLALRVAVPMMGWTTAVVTISGVVGVVTLGLAWLLTRLILRPVTALVTWAEFMRSDQADPAPVPTHFGTREFSDMAQSLLAMGEELQWRVSDLSNYSAHVTHELRSPLTSLRASAELLQSDPPAETRAELVETIAAATERMEALLVAMRALAQSEAASGHQVDLVPVTAIAHRVAKRLQLNLTVNGTPSVPLPEAQLELVFDHLFQNARDHGAASIELLALQAGFAVIDDGPGVSANNAERLFDPFFTTRRSDGGMGLGLFLVHRITQARGGTVTFMGNQPGARFDIYFQKAASNQT